MNPNEQTVAANIERLVNQLNGELKIAHELGLKVWISGNRLLLSNTPTQVSVQLSRETMLVQVPPPSTIR